jgi:molybdenum cofactor guanylyltransferase
VTSRVSETDKVSTPLYGLVLAGGRSSRMQRDKAALPYDGVTQLERAMTLISEHVDRAYVSVRADQRDDPIRARFPQIIDAAESLGPISGIAAAQAKHPEAAWLVLACDLPFLDAATLKHLLWARQAGRDATAYRSSHDGLPEPLCAIYEPASRTALVNYLASGKHCPRKFLVQSNTALLDEPNPRALDNINTPEEYRAAMNLQMDSPGRQIEVQYYALLREQAGRTSEKLETCASTPRELYEELRVRYPFSLAPEVLRVAVNAEFSDWERRLADGDAVTFIPPVAGG